MLLSHHLLLLWPDIDRLELVSQWASAIDDVLLDDILMMIAAPTPLLDHLEMIIVDDARQLVRWHGLDWALLGVATLGRALRALAFDFLEQTDQLLLLCDYVLDQHRLKRLRNAIVFVVAPVMFILAIVDIFVWTTFDLAVLQKHASAVWTILVPTRVRLGLNTRGRLLSLPLCLCWAFIDSQELLLHSLLVTHSHDNISLIDVILSYSPDCIIIDFNWLWLLDDLLLLKL